jgi:hypothetical protein
MKIFTTMKKNTVKTNIKQIKSISQRMPKSLTEALNFNENDEMDFDMEDDSMDYDSMDHDYMSDEQVNNVPPKNPIKKQSMDNPGRENDDSNIENFISNMRKESLGIMKALADNPDDSVYQFAKKIFQLADKAHEDQKEGKDINGQPKQQMNQQQSM